MDASQIRVERGEFELRGWRSGTGSHPILCLHESATSSEVWRPLAAAIGERASTFAIDRRGWGRSGAPPDYRGTTITEQAADAEAVIEATCDGPATLCGAGIGAIVALELALRRDDAVAAAILVEPPLLGLVAEATATVSADAEAIRRETALVGARLGEGATPLEAATIGARAALDLYLGGGLAAIGAGADRIPDEIADRGGARPFVLFAEIAAVSGWTVPLAELAGIAAPLAVALARSTPPFTRRAGEALAARLPGADLRELPSADLPQLTASEELAAIALELSP